MIRLGKNFASDNNSGVHSEIIKAIMEVNVGHVLAYGDDPFTERAIEKFKEIFGNDIKVFFTLTGTGANVLGMKPLLNSFNSVISPESAHINCDECGAPEKFWNSKIQDISTSDGKLTVDMIKPYINVLHPPHQVVPKIVSITQVTEFGTIYSIEEIKEIADFCHKNGLFLHMDGARIANAAVSLNADFKAFTKDAGVDILSFGGTKNGLMFGEAVIFFRPELAENFEFYRKQGMQLFSKMRYIATQFERYLTDNLWRRNAENANNMAKLLAEKVKDLDKVRVFQEVRANGVFVELPKDIIPKLQEKYYFYLWNEEKNQVRWMTAFDTTEKDVENFVDELKRLLSEN